MSGKERHEISQRQLRRGLQQMLEGFSMAGAQFMPRPSSTAIADHGARHSGVPSGTTDSGEADAALQVIAEEVNNCTLCPELVAQRSRTVFGVGTSTPRLCLVGEAPGADEDRLGEPFVGRAGQLLDKILAACTLSREQVYILNVIKCRPPGNRNPTSDEICNCRGYYERQLEILNPEFICCLGTVPAQALLETKTGIGRLRGRFHDWHGVPVLATYHPAYLLRNPSAKAEVWKDMQLLMREMGIELPQRK
jgi:DNA polymerase